MHRCIRVPRGSKKRWKKTKLEKKKQHTHRAMQPPHATSNLSNEMHFSTLFPLAAPKCTCSSDVTEIVAFAYQDNRTSFCRKTSALSTSRNAPSFFFFFSKNHPRPDSRRPSTDEKQPKSSKKEVRRAASQPFRFDFEEMCSGAILILRKQKKKKMQSSSAASAWF